MNVAIIGCGGTGGWVANLLAKMLQPEDTLVLIDKDKFEKKNMDRQLNCRVGMNKAAALAKALSNSRCTFEVLEDWFTPTLTEGLHCLFCCADNHRARVATMQYADMHLSTAYIAGNEYTSFDACVYRAWMQGDMLMDPRERFPEMLVDTTGDPMTPSCTGEVLEGSPQLALANMQAETALCRLWYLWEFTVPTLGLGFCLEGRDDEDQIMLHKLRQTITYRISGTETSLVTERVT